MYEAFYGLRERPFELTPNPRFLFMTAHHREALTTLEYGLSGRTGIALLVGDAGTGKTTIIHSALQSQSGARASRYLNNPR
jgi:general secretion pathway protein A